MLEFWYMQVVFHYFLDIELKNVLPRSSMQTLLGKACNCTRKIAQTCDRSHAQMKLLATPFPYITACVSSRYMALFVSAKICVANTRFEFRSSHSIKKELLYKKSCFQKFTVLAILNLLLNRRLSLIIKIKLQ